MLEVTCGYGTSVNRWLVSACSIILAFAASYLVTFSRSGSFSIRGAFHLSLVSFIPLFPTGLLSDEISSQRQALQGRVVLESVIGWAMAIMLLITLSGVWVE